MPTDSSEYRSRKHFYDQMLTIYGRKPVLEALSDSTLPAYKLHLADSNRDDGIISEIKRVADSRGITVAYHSRQALSRISRNGKQDQGVALDLQLPSYRDYQTLLTSEKSNQRLIALDRITNPQNLGMIIRSVAASGITGLILPKNGCASLSPLVAKASAGTLFKAPIYYCDELGACLEALANAEFSLATLSSHAKQSLLDHQPAQRSVYVLGNETDGVSSGIAKRCAVQLAIPMHNGVESLNVAITAALIAFYQRP